MLQLNHLTLSLICNILVVTIILMSASCHCRVLQSNDVELIEETCKRTPNPTLCVQLLKADPRAPNADITGLALIMVDVIKAKAIATLNKINQLLKGGGNNKSALSECAENYKLGILIGDVPQAKEALQLGEHIFADDGAIDSAVEAESCEDGFNGKSPLTNENNDMSDVAYVARAIIGNLL